MKNKPLIKKKFSESINNIKSNLLEKLDEKSSEEDKENIINDEFVNKKRKRYDSTNTEAENRMESQTKKTKSSITITRLPKVIDTNIQLEKDSTTYKENEILTLEG